MFVEAIISKKIRHIIIELIQPNLYFHTRILLYGIIWLHIACPSAPEIMYLAFRTVQGARGGFLAPPRVILFKNACM
jgi:hypothetical protein